MIYRTRKVDGRVKEYDISRMLSGQIKIVMSMLEQYAAGTSTAEFEQSFFHTVTQMAKKDGKASHTVHPLRMIYNDMYTNVGIKNREFTGMELSDMVLAADINDQTSS